MNRGIAHASIFANDDDRREFLDCLAVCSARFAVEVHAYCLMGNHFHLLLLSKAARLAEAMQHLSSRFTQRLNYRDGRDGPRFRGRYASFLLSDDAQLLRVHRYVHLNPVAARLCARAEDWAWSSAAAYVGRAPGPAWLEKGSVLAMFGHHDAQRRYREFLDAGVDPPTRDAYRSTEQDGWS